MPKFLILRFSSIGDIVLTTPVVRCLKLQFTDVEVHYATKKQYLSLLENNPYIDKIHALDNNFGEFIEALKSEKFDYIIDLHNNLRTLRIKLNLFIKSVSFDKLNFEKWLLVNFKINRLPNHHIVDRYLKTLERFGVENDGKGLDFFIPKKDIIQLNDLKKPSSFIAFAIGGQHFTKKLPIPKLIEFCKKISLSSSKTIVLLGGKEDFEAGEAVKKALGKAVFNACGKFNLNQSASILQQADYVISHDTGLMHVAAAFKKRIISIWGNTVPEFGMFPYETNFEVIENKDLSCRPCSKIGFDKCPLGHFKCMNELQF